MVKIPGIQMVTVLALAAGCGGGSPRTPDYPPPLDPLSGPASRSSGTQRLSHTSDLDLPDLEVQAYNSRSIPGGVACLIRLREMQVPFDSIEQLKGVDTPVRITGPVGGIHYPSLGRRSLECDCRFALALLRAAPILRNLGVTEMHFSSAYRYTRAPSGRLSRHAYGLALDVHRVTVAGELLWISRDYQVALGDGCRGDSPALNRMACLMKKWGLFDRVLTPDYNEAHHNHFHLAILSHERRRFIPQDAPARPVKD